MRRPLLLLTLALGFMSCPAPAPAQVLRIQALRVPEDAAPGPWASFHVRTQSRNLPPREFTQRVAVVAAEGIGADAGVWIELTTVDRERRAASIEFLRGRGFTLSAARKWVQRNPIDEIASAWPRGAKRDR